MFALLAQYHAVIPHVYKYRIAAGSATPTNPQNPSQTRHDQSQASSSASSNGTTSSQDAAGILFSDKTTTYVLAAQLALSQLPGSLLAAVVGWGMGIAWRNYVLPEKMIEWRVSGRVVGEKAESGEGFEGLRRRLEGEGRASGVEGAVDSDGGGDGARRRADRGMGRGIVDQFRGMF